MKKYARHILTAIISFAVILIVNFALPRLMPGDPVHYLTGLDVDVISQELYDRYYTALGLNLPLAEQFEGYLKSVFDGTLGYSYHFNSDVATLISERLPYTLQIALPAVIVSTALSLWLGLRAARRPRSLADNAITSSAIIANSMPSFFAAMLLLVVFSFKLDWFPLGNLSSPDTDISSAAGFFDRLWHLVLPVATLVIATTPPKIIMLRNNAAGGADEKYLVYAKTKGLSPRRISYVHLFPNIGQPFITMTGMNIGGVIGGSIVIETVFSINGMGLLMSQAIDRLDFPVLQGCLTVTAGIVILVTILTDLLLMIADPKIRRGAKNET